MKPIEFMGRSLEAIRSYPPLVRREAGYELDKVQRGDHPLNWKAMPDLGLGVRELRIEMYGAWRVVYVANRSDAIYVLHAFQKKSLATSRRDIAQIRASYRELK